MARGRAGRRTRQSAIWRYWGLIVVLVMLVGFNLQLGVLPYVAMTGLVLFWTLFSAPTWCGAINRSRGHGIEYCRHNSSGLLLGCHLRQHKFQRFRRDWWQEGWRDRTRGIWQGAPAKLATVTSVLGVVLGVAGIIK